MVFSARVRSLSKSVLAALTAILLPAAAWAAVDLNKSFSPATVYPGQVSRLVFTLQNSDLVPATSAEFSDLLPDGLRIAPMPNLVNECLGDVSLSNGTAAGTVGLAGGVIPAGDGANPGKCTIALDVVAETSGTFLNEIPAGALTADVAGLGMSSATPALASLTVVLENVTLSMSTAIGATIQGYETSIQRIRITNPNPVPLTGAAISFDMRTMAPHIRALPGQPSGSSCGGTVSFMPQTPASSSYGPTTLVALSGGTVPASGWCEIWYTIEPSRDPMATASSPNITITLPPGFVTTTQGATNSLAATHGLRAATGISVSKLFNGVQAHSFNFNDTQSAQLRIRVTSYNTQPVTGAALTDAFPAGLTADSIDASDCGLATIQPSGIQISGMTVPAVTYGQNGNQQAFCDMTATVSVSAPGSYSNNLPAGNLSGYNFASTTATLAVSGEILSISKTFSRSTIYAGDTVDATFTIRNLSGANPVTNIRIPDNIAGSMGHGWSVAPAGLVSNSCGGTTNIVPGAGSFTTAGMSVPPEGTCAFTVRIISSGDAYDRTSGNGTHTNRIAAGSILFDYNGTANIPFGQIVSGQTSLAPPYVMTKAFTPSLVSSTGTSRLRVNISRRSLDRIGMSQIRLRDVLPAHAASGQVVVAAVPNILNGCGGTVTAVPGSGTIELSDGVLQFPAGTATTVSCYFEVDVRTPAIVGTEDEQTVTNTVPREPRGTPRVHFEAQDMRQTGASGRIHNSIAFSAPLTWRRTQLPISVEFRPAVINGGGVSRVRILFSNIDSTSIKLTGLGLDGTLTGSNMTLYSDVDPLFSSLAGVPNTGGCRGGTFSGNPGEVNFGLASAEIDAYTTCMLEFNVTAFTGGNHVLAIGSGDVVTSEGVTNPHPVSATLTVGYQVGVGKGFSPASMEVGGTSTLVLDIYNTNARPLDPLDPSNDYHGASPALIDLMPAGLEITTDPVTTCAGATVTRGVDGTGRHFIRVDGGTFEASRICKVTAQVSAAAAGTYTNRIEIGDLVTLDGGNNPDPAVASLRVIRTPTIVKSFNPGTTQAGALSRIQFRIANPNTAAALPSGLTGASFSDTLTGMEVASPLYIATTCPAMSHNAAPGATSLVFSNIRVPAGSYCDISIDVTSTVPGSHPNQASGLTASQYAGAGAPSNTVWLTIATPAILEKLFDKAEAETGEAVRMTFRITNPNAFPVPLGSPSMTDAFPAGMVVADPPAISANCGIQVRRTGSTSVLPAADDTGVDLRGGTVPANGECAVGIDVTSTVVGVLENTVASFTSAGGIAGPATATVEFVLARPDLEVTKVVSVISENLDGTFDCAAGAAEPGAEAAIPGACIEYLVTVRNAESSPADGENIAVEDIFPPAIDYAWHQNNGFGTLVLMPGSAGLSGTIPLLEPGDEASFTVRAIVGE